MKPLVVVLIAFVLCGCATHASGTATTVTTVTVIVTTATLPKVTRTNTVEPTATATLMPVTETPSPKPKPTITTAPTPTPWPTFTRTPLTIDPRIQDPVQAALSRLALCSPRTFAFVTQEISLIGPDESIDVAVADLRPRQVRIPGVYFTRPDMSPNLREFNIMRMLAHETYHISEWSSDESAANRFSLRVFDDCASTVPPEDQAQLAAMRAFVEQQTK